MSEEIGADPTTEHRIATTAIRIRLHLPANAKSIAVTPCLPSVMPFASGVLLESLHVEMRRSHAMVAALVSEAVASGTAFEDVARRGVLPREDGHPELRVP